MQNKIITKIVKPTINQIAKYIPGESSIDGKENVIKLSSNESPFKVPNKVSAISKKLIPSFKADFISSKSFELFFLCITISAKS